MSVQMVIVIEPKIYILKITIRVDLIKITPAACGGALYLGFWTPVCAYQVMDAKAIYFHRFDISL